MGSRNFKNIVDGRLKPDPKELRKNFDLEELKDSTPFPNPLTYDDIDREFKKWVNESLEISYEGKRLPTMTLYSNQRFSEYLQAWKFTDEDMNPILNFKTVTRENNPKSGTINGDSKNIPGEHTWLMKRVRAHDKNNREYFIEYRMKQPYSVDLNYKIGLFTNKYELVNKFNELVNERFKAIDAYIRPNGHYISMILTDIGDDSEYSIDDRQYYSQSFSITVRAYIIPEDSFIVEEVPRMVLMGFDVAGEGSYADISFGGGNGPAKIQSIKTETDDCIDNKPYRYCEVTLKVVADPCDSLVSFTMDTNFTAKKDQFVAGENLKYFKVKINGDTVCESERLDGVVTIPDDIEFHSGDLVKICGIVRRRAMEPAELVFGGFTTDDIAGEECVEEITVE